MLTLLGLPDDYSHDGRALFELADTNALPVALRGHTAALTTLASVFKQLNACVGQFGAATITVSSKAINSTSPGDVRYQLTETALAQLAPNETPSPPRPSPSSKAPSSTTPNSMSRRLPP